MTVIARVNQRVRSKGCRLTAVSLLSAAIFFLGVSSAPEAAVCLASAKACGVNTAANDRLCCPGLVCGWGGVCQPGCRIGGQFYRAGSPNPANACQSCQPGISTKSWSAVANETPCSDANACTTRDTCRAGFCAGGPALECSDSNPCTTDGCNPATGCFRTDNSDSCDDGDACTANDTCSGGACDGGPQVVCDDREICTDDTCDSSVGCVFAPNTVPCDDGDACTANDTCSGGTCQGGQPPTIEGREFWVLFNPNNSASGRRDVHVAGAPGTQVTIAGGAPITIPAAGVLTVDTGLGRIPTPNTLESGKSFRITASAPVQVFANNFQPFTVDAFTVVPVQLLGTDYRAIGYPNSIGQPSQLSVYATEDDTTVTIGGGAPFTMNRGQSYLRSAVGDATGLRVTADKPVGVNSGDACLNTGAGACDHVEEMLFPVESWGSDFFIPTIPQGQNFRVVAATDGTTVTVDGAPVATLDAGQFYSGSGGGKRVQTGHPAEVYVIALGDTSGSGDPAFILIPGVQNAIADATFSALAADNTNTLAISIPTAAIASLRIDGAPVSVGWTAFSSGGYSYAQIVVSAGAHRVTADEPFIPVLWGEKSFESYGYVGGYGYLPEVCTDDAP